MTTTVTINKKAVAAELYMSMKKANPNVTRKEVLFAFVDKAGLTQNGASTYYANFGENGIWRDAVSGLAKVDKKTGPVQTTNKVDFESMDLYSLTQYFNEHSSLFKVDRFSDKKDAIEMIAKYCK